MTKHLWKPTSSYIKDLISRRAWSWFSQTHESQCHTDLASHSITDIATATILMRLLGTNQFWHNAFPHMINNGACWCIHSNFFLKCYCRDSQNLGLGFLNSYLTLMPDFEMATILYCQQYLELFGKNFCFTWMWVFLKNLA